MAENSKIEWTHHTFNPVLGCQKVGPGCDNCYAEAWSKRSGLVEWGPKAERRVTSDAYWKQLRKWDSLAAAAGERHKVFCASLADVMDNAWPAGVRRRLGVEIEATPNLIYLLLTKRIGNAGRFLPEMFPGCVPENVWMGATIVDREEMLRDAPKLRDVPAAIRFWSVEPLLADLGEIPSDLMPDLIIVGGESGPGARVWAGFEDAARSLRDQCRSAGVAFFMKQMAGVRKASMPPIPDDLMIREMPGVTHG